MKTTCLTILLLLNYMALSAQVRIHPGKDSTTTSKPLTRKPLYVVFSSGKIIMKSTSQDTSVLNKIDPAFIQSMTVIKDSTAIKKYGSDAKYGVVEINMKDGKFPKQLVIKNTVAQADLKVRKPLYVVFSFDKVILKSESQDTSFLKKIDPASIQSMNVISDGAGIKKYGNDAQDGVVEIHMKDGTYPKGYKPQ